MMWDMYFKSWTNLSPQDPSWMDQIKQKLAKAADSNFFFTLEILSIEILREHTRRDTVFFCSFQWAKITAWTQLIETGILDFSGILLQTPQA